VAVAEFGGEEDVRARAGVAAEPGAEEVFIVAVDVGGGPRRLVAAVG
jgi:hypothetical protein